MLDNLSDKEAESLVIKIKKLMALSKSSNENEAALAAAKAQELLVKYNIEMSQVENVKLDREETRLVNDFKELFGLNVIEWKRDLAFAVAKGNLCKGVYSGKGMYFLGKKANVEVAQFMYEVIMHDLERIAEEKWQQIQALRKMQEQFPDVDLFSDRSLLHVHGKTWKASFYVGAVRTIRDRLEENLTAMEADNPSITALITLDSAKLKEFMNQQFPKLISVKSAQASYRAAYESGRIAGHDIQFTRGIRSGSTVSGPLSLGDGKRN
jgi:hypothetical protein